MGTISDKLMRIINTKEDIRQALISKGYDIPTSIPFKEYAKMILDLPCNADSFPDIEGIVARYSASGLTNEQMAANPVWVDKTGNGYDLQLKNFSWGGMSGVGGYVDNWNSSADWAINSYWVNSHTDHKLQFITASSVVQARSNNIYNAENVYKNILNVNGLTEAVNKGSVKALRIIATDPITSKAIKTFSFETDGVIQISFDDVLQDYYVDYFLYGSDTKDIDITIEQLPLYPGFILGDGVDDFAVTEKELNFEDTYTVYTAFIPFQDDPTRNMILCGADSKKTFSMQYSSLVYVSFIAGNNYYINADFVNGLNLFACKRNGNNICIKNLLTNKVVTGTCGDWVENAGPYYLWKNATYASFAKAAIAGQTICNGYFSTDEDDEKVLDWYKKQYPWLFPDQAWTVTGKTNEDEDRATIANITGNGNDLVLSNFGFSGNSGYGLYNIQKFTNWNHVADRGDIVKNGYSVTITNSKITGSSTNYNTDILYSYNSSSTTIIFKVTGLVDGQKIFLGRKSVTDAYVIDKDGIYRSDYNIPQEDGKVIVGIGTVGFTGECNITIEQIPEYEGYLVTDGVDDRVQDSSFKLNKDWTLVGEWVLLNQKATNAGITKPFSFIVYNRTTGLSLFINTGTSGITIENVKSIKAICSDGRIYLDDWSEMLISKDQDITSSTSVLSIGFNGTAYTQIAFKNLGIYNNQILSKDDCIKAYNYLQTLKAK
jgi:hypothetical protein